jgi:hypothetical protein
MLDGERLVVDLAIIDRIERCPVVELREPGIGGGRRPQPARVGQLEDVGDRRTI